MKELPINGQLHPSASCTLLEKRLSEILQPVAMEDIQPKPVTPEPSPAHTPTPSPGVSPGLSPAPSPSQEGTVVPAANNVEVLYP